MANPVRELFDNEPAAARVVLVDTLGIPYKASGGGAGSDVNIDSIGGNPVTTTIPVSGTVSVTEPVSVDDNGGSLTVDGPLTNAELRAVPVPVSGTVSTTGLTDAELRATPVPVSGTVSVNEPVTVDATDLDIRNLVFATDKVDVSGSSGVGVTGTFFQATQPISAPTLPLPTGAATSALQTQPGVDIGDVTINNGAAGAAVNIQDGGNTITVDGTVTAAAQPGVDIGDVTINNASGGSAVNIQDGGNTITVDGTVSVNLNAGTNTNEVVGDVAADAPAAGNPVLVAASSETMADSAPANRVSQDADATRISATDGAIFVIPTGPQTWTYHEDSSSALTDATVHAAPSSGLSLYVTDIVFSSGAATAINIFFEEGASKVLGPWYLEAVAGRGFAIHFGTPKKITAATALTVTTSAAIAHSVDVQGFIAPG